MGRRRERKRAKNGEKGEGKRYKRDGLETVVIADPYEKAGTAATHNEGVVAFRRGVKVRRRTR